MNPGLRQAQGLRFAAKPQNLPPRIGWVYHPDFLKHDTGADHPECPARLEVILEALEASDLREQLIPIDFGWATPAQAALAHEPAYIYLLQQAAETGFQYIGSTENVLCSESADTALLAAGGGIAACRAVLDGTIDRAFCALRPPGHHATSMQAMGFCLLNHVAIAAAWLLAGQGLSRVAILDIDVHHGNGTQEIFYARDDVLYVSLHERSGTLPFPGTGEEDECGKGPGKGFTLNIPLLAGAGEKEYLHALEHQAFPRIREFQPEFILLSCGLDALYEDRMANMQLTPDSYRRLTHRICELADTCCQGRLVSMLEGGYSLFMLGETAMAHVQGLMD